MLDFTLTFPLPQCPSEQPHPAPPGGVRRWAMVKKPRPKTLIVPMTPPTRVLLVNVVPPAPLVPKVLLVKLVALVKLVCLVPR